MTPRRSLTGTLVRALAPDRPWLRRTIVLVLVAICAFLTLFPERYRAAVSLTPTDPASLGLSGTLGQLGAVGNVFGNQTAVEVGLKVARSDYVRKIVAHQLNLPRRLDKSDLETTRWLDRKVAIRALRGGIMEFELKDGDADFAREVVAAYAVAVREQLATVARVQTAYKRRILLDLVEQSSRNLATTQAAYDTFRLRTRYSSPQAAIAAVGDRVPKLEDSIKQKQVQLNAARQFFTDDNINIRQILAELSALQAQLNDARSTSLVDVNSVGRVVRDSTEVDRLRRDLDLAQGLYDSYKRYLQGTSVEDLTSTANVRILEPAYIDSERQYNLAFLALGLLILAIGAAMEFYVLRPPVGDRVIA